MGVAVSKKHGKAHVRNRVKRLARAAFDANCTLLEKNYSIIILPKVAGEYTYKGFENSLTHRDCLWREACIPNKSVHRGRYAAKNASGRIL